MVFERAFGESENWGVMFIVQIWVKKQSREEILYGGDDGQSGRSSIVPIIGAGSGRELLAICGFSALSSSARPVHVSATRRFKAFAPGGQNQS